MVDKLVIFESLISSNSYYYCETTRHKPDIGCIGCIRWTGLRLWEPWRPWHQKSSLVNTTRAFGETNFRENLRFFFLWNTSWDEWNFMVKDDGEKVTVALSWKASAGDFHCQWKLDRIRSATILWITHCRKKDGWRILKNSEDDGSRFFNVLNSHGSNPYTWGDFHMGKHN